MGQYCDDHVPVGANVQPVFYSYDKKCDDCSNFAKYEDVVVDTTTVVEEPIV